SWIRPDPGEFSKRGINFQNLSGESMRWLYRRMTVRCSQFRDWFAEGWLKPLLLVFLRIVAKNTGGIITTDKDALTAAARVASRDLAEVDGVTIWAGPDLRVEWPRF